MYGTPIAHYSFAGRSRRRFDMTVEGKLVKDTSSGIKIMYESLIMLGAIGGWILLQAFILPRLGVET